MKTFNDLQKLIGSLALNLVQRKKLNIVAGNAMRRVVRSNLKTQKDIHGKSFKGYKHPQKNKFKHAVASGKISMNKKMFSVASRLLRQYNTDTSVSIGFNDPAATIFRSHNSGGEISFKRSSGKFVAYAMPKREFLGWSPEMVKQVEKSVIDQYLKFQGA